jgi:aminomethyltransferase
MDTLKTTPLRDWHASHGAKMVPFAGWDMPVQYPTGIMAEHKQTREKAAIFDICHMGEFTLSGPGARDALARLVTQNLDTLAPGRCRYGFLPNEAGGVIDDLIVYCLAEDSYMLVVNGAREETDFAWIRDRLPAGLSFVNASADTGKIDVQGPLSAQAVEEALKLPCRQLKYFTFEQTTLAGAPAIVSRTGYTGELGFELYVPWDQVAAVWELLAAHPAVAPAGLGARDTLRLEMGYPLYGQDLDEAHTPAEAGYEAMLTSTAEHTAKGKVREVRERLIALKIPGRRSARHYDRVLSAAGEDVGVVTSGSFSPTLGHGVALAYLRADAAGAESFTVRAAKAELAAERVELPFFTGGTARQKLG